MRLYLDLLWGFVPMGESVIIRTAFNVSNALNVTLEQDSKYTAELHFTLGIVWLSGSCEGNVIIDIASLGRGEKFKVGFVLHAHCSCTDIK